jgi:hypothetical protein
MNACRLVLGLLRLNNFYSSQQSCRSSPAQKCPEATGEQPICMPTTSWFGQKMFPLVHITSVHLDLAARAKSRAGVLNWRVRPAGIWIRTVLHTRYSIPLTICGDSNGGAQTDNCLSLVDSTILLVVREDKTQVNGKNLEALVVAEAIAAFQYNNRKRGERGLWSLDSMTVPCITIPEFLHGSGDERAYLCGYSGTISGAYYYCLALRAATTSPPI